MKLQKLAKELQNSSLSDVATSDSETLPLDNSRLLVMNVYFQTFTDIHRSNENPISNVPWQGKPIFHLTNVINGILVAMENNPV
jgi:hypothetical protein